MVKNRETPTRREKKKEDKVEEANSFIVHLRQIKREEKKQSASDQMSHSERGDSGV